MGDRSGAAVEAAARLAAWLAAQDPNAFASVTLINNAAALTRIGPIERAAMSSCRRRCASASRRRCC